MCHWSRVLGPFIYENNLILEYDAQILNHTCFTVYKCFILCYKFVSCQIILECICNRVFLFLSYTSRSFRWCDVYISGCWAQSIAKEMEHRFPSRFPNWSRQISWWHDNWDMQSIIYIDTTWVTGYCSHEWKSTNLRH